MNNSSKICIFIYLAKWLSCSFDRIILQKKGGGGPVALQVFGYLKVQLELLIFSNVFKQFVVKNCSNERPSSIVNETLKYGILMLKDTSKESNLHDDFKYISFIKFTLCHQKLRA